jgi:hypothetical protein
MVRVAAGRALPDVGAGRALAGFLVWVSVRLPMQYILPIQGHFEMHI